MKQLIILSKITNTDFDKIIYDILEGDYKNYDYKQLSGYDDLYRIRVGGYRIIFKVNDNEIKIILIGNRGDVYKRLKKMFG